MGILQTPLLLQTADVSKGTCPEILGEGRAHILINEKAKVIAIKKQKSINQTPEVLLF
jgi:hypothetical protein